MEVNHEVAAGFAGQQTPRRPGRRIFQDGRAGNHRVVRHLSRHGRPLLDAPGRAVEAPQVDPALDRYQLKNRRLSQSMVLHRACGDHNETIEHSSGHF